MGCDDTLPVEVPITGQLLCALNDPTIVGSLPEHEFNVAEVRRFKQSLTRLTDGGPLGLPFTAVRLADLCGEMFCTPDREDLTPAQVAVCAVLCLELYSLRRDWQRVHPGLEICLAEALLASVDMDGSARSSVAGVIEAVRTRCSDGALTGTMELQDERWVVDSASVFMSALEKRAGAEFSPRLAPSPEYFSTRIESCRNAWNRFGTRVRDRAGFTPDMIGRLDRLAGNAPG